MYDNYNYPMGADNESAPWNEKQKPPQTKRLNVIMTVSKEMDIDTYDYGIEPPEYPEYMGGVDFSYVDWEKDFTEQYYDIPTLLRRMSDLLTKWMPKDVSGADKREYNDLIREAAGWHYDEIQIEDA